MRGKIANRIRGLFYKACEINGWWIHEVAINPDHVHIFIQINPTDTLSRVVQQLKGGSSIVIRKEFPGLEEFLWGDSFWADGYFAETSGKISEKRIIQYIIEQNKSMPH